MQLVYYTILFSKLEAKVAELRRDASSCELLTAVNNAWIKLDEYHKRSGSVQANAMILNT